MEVYLGAFLAGIGATATPCILPLYPGFLAYLTSGAQPATSGAGDEGPWASPLSPVLAALTVWVGVVVGMLAIGALVAALSIPLGDVNRVVLPVADVLVIGLGAMLLVGANPFARLPQPSATALGGRGAAVGAFGYGLLFAPITVPCSGPFLVGIFAFSLTIGDALGRLLFFGIFGIGFGFPLFLLGTVGQSRAVHMARAMARHERPLQLVVGAVLVAVGAWDVLSTLPLVLARANS